MLVNVLVWLPDLEKWFGESGVMTLASSKTVVDKDALTLFEWLPRTATTLWICYSAMLVALIGVLLGIGTRFCLAVVFVLFTSFAHRNNLIVDSEDTVFRLMTFYLFLAPAGEYWSLKNWLAKHRNQLPRATSTNSTESGERAVEQGRGVKKFSIWPLRLIQIQTSLILFTTGIEKLQGKEWLDGTALFYVSRLDDFFYRFPVPGFLFESSGWIALMTWATLVIELGLPILIWIPKTRWFALIGVFIFHLSLEYSMNLFLFQWIMMVGWLSFWHWPATENVASAED